MILRLRGSYETPRALLSSPPAIAWPLAAHSSPSRFGRPDGARCKRPRRSRGMCGPTRNPWSWDWRSIRRAWDRRLSSVRKRLMAALRLSRDRKRPRLKRRARAANAKETRHRTPACRRNRCLARWRFVNGSELVICAVRSRGVPNIEPFDCAGQIILLTIVIISAAEKARNDSVRTLPRALILKLSAVAETSSGASTIVTMSYLPLRPK